MTVRDLNREQLNELKQAYATQLEDLEKIYITEPVRTYKIYRKYGVI